VQCEDARAEMTAYLAEELNLEARARLDTHLAGCVLCRTEMAALRETWEALSALPVPSPAPDLERRVLAGIAPEVSSRWIRRLVPALRPLRVPIAALMAALVSIGLSTLLPYEAAARLCGEGLKGVLPASGLGNGASAFLAGTVYAALPLVLVALLTARLNGHPPLLGGGSTAALFVLVLTPYVVAVCGGLPAAFVGSLLAGLTMGAFTGGVGGFCLGRRWAPKLAAT